MMPPENTPTNQRMVPIHEGLSRRQADTFGLVLSSAKLTHRVLQSSKGWQILVPIKIETEAMAVIGAYLAENETGDKASHEFTWPITRTLAGVWMVLILVGVHLYSTTTGQTATMRHVYGASADKILQGEVYRICTALLIHADVLHLMGNVVGLLLFGTVVCGTAGFGAGGLMILISGMAGNLVNALLFETGHHSIGASTAVFGAVGIAAAHQFIVIWRQTHRRFKAWIPLAGGLALLGMMGSSTNSDLTAHFFGFVAGFGMGIFFSAVRQEPPGKSAQYGCLLLTVVLLTASLVIK